MNRSFYDRSKGEFLLGKLAAYSRTNILHTRERTTSNLQYLEIRPGAALFVIGIVGVIHTWLGTTATTTRAPRDGTPSSRFQSRYGAVLYDMVRGISQLRVVWLVLTTLPLIRPKIITRWVVISHGVMVARRGPTVEEIAMRDGPATRTHGRFRHGNRRIHVFREKVSFTAIYAAAYGKESFELMNTVISKVQIMPAHCNEL